MNNKKGYEDFIKEVQDRHAKAMAQKAVDDMLKKQGSTENLLRNATLAQFIGLMTKRLKEKYPDSSMILIATRQLDCNTMNVVKECYGNVSELSGAVAESMHTSNDILCIINRAVSKFCDTSSKDEAETAITEFEQMIKKLREKNTPEMRVSLLKDEVRRLRKKGQFEQTKAKQKELEELEASIESRKVMKAKRLEWLKKAREALAEKRRKKEEEKRRAKQQPNFAKMAKQKMKKIMERQAERNQRKSAGNGDGGVKSCSMFQNVG